MEHLTIICAFAVLLGVVRADSVIELGFKLTPKPPTVEWKEGVEINMTCSAECSLPCSSCSAFKYSVESRNRTYLPSQKYDDFRMHPVLNLTDSYQSKCRFEQTVTLLKVKKNESGTVRCISMTSDTRAGLAFLYIFYDVTYTNATLPTEVTLKDADVEATGGKIPVKLRVFNTTVDKENVPFVSCVVVGGSAGATFQWSWRNGSKFTGGADQTVDTVPSSTGGAAGAPVSVTSRLVFRTYAEKAAQILGAYKCLIERNSTEKYPVVMTPPVVKMSDKDYRSSMEGDTMTQSCTVVAYPEAVVTWSKNNQTLFAEGVRIKFSADNATLTISSLKQEDAGLYICSAENSLGIGQAYIKLRVKDRLAALWPFLGILAEVIILVTIILLYEKKRAAQKRSQEEQDGGDVNKEERNANDSEVRHRPVKT